MLSNSQQIVFDALADITAWPSSKILIQGNAGCGKTYLASKLIAHWRKQNENIDIVVIAPTHQAKSVLAQKLQDANVKPQTVANFLGKFPIRKYDSATSIFANGNMRAQENSIVVIDEVSMVSQPDIERLLSCKMQVVFLGDRAQLAPVKQKKHDIWSHEHKYLLIEQMRNDGSIEKLANLNREKPYFPAYTCADEQVVVHENENALLTSFIAKVRESEIGQAVWLTYTNEKANKINNAVRHALGYNTITPFSVGEKVKLQQNHLAIGYNCELAEITAIRAQKNQYVWEVELKGTLGKCFTDVLDPMGKDWFKSQVEAAIASFRAAQESGDDVSYAVKLIDELLDGTLQIAPPYAMTVHKSQGSSINYIYIDANDMRGQAMTYVAFSRTRLQLNVTRRANKIVHPCNKAQFAELTSALGRNALWCIKMHLRITSQTWDGRQALIDFLELNPEYTQNDNALTLFKRVRGVKYNLRNV